MYLVFVSDSVKEEFIKKFILCFDRYDRGLFVDFKFYVVQLVFGLNGFVVIKFDFLNKVFFNGLGVENIGKLDVYIDNDDDILIRVNLEYFDN